VERRLRKRRGGKETGKIRGRGVGGGKRVSATSIAVNCLFVGARFLCSVLVAPVRNETSEIILFIVNLEDITDAPLKQDSYRGSLRHSLCILPCLLLLLYRFYRCVTFSLH